MLDESLCGFPDALAAVKSPTADMFNVRLSKCGGILPTLRIVGLANGRGWGCNLAAIRVKLPSCRRSVGTSPAVWPV